MDGAQRIAQQRVGAAFPGDISDVVTYVLGDFLGSSNVRLNTSGGLIDREEYYPFGDSSLRTFTSKRYRYVGREKDQESGLYYYGARYYASWTCRFISVDPLAAKFVNLTPYNYAGNKPITHFDIDGMQSTGDTPTEGGGNTGAIGPPQLMPNGTLKHADGTIEFAEVIVTGVRPLPYANGHQGPWTHEYSENQKFTQNPTSNKKPQPGPWSQGYVFNNVDSLSLLDHTAIAIVNEGVDFFMALAIGSMPTGNKLGYETYMQAGLLLSNFATGKGPEVSVFYGNTDAIAQVLNRDNRLVSHAINMLNKTLELENKTAEEYFNEKGTFQTGYAFSPDHTATNQESFVKHLEAAKHPIDILVGGMNVRVSPIRNLESEKAEIIGYSITYHNPMSRNSLLLHEGENIEDREGGEGSPLSTTQQYFVYFVYY